MQAADVYKPPVKWLFNISPSTGLTNTLKAENPVTIGERNISLTQDQINRADRLLPMNSSCQTNTSFSDNTDICNIIRVASHFLFISDGIKTKSCTQQIINIFSSASLACEKQYWGGDYFERHK